MKTKKIGRLAVVLAIAVAAVAVIAFGTKRAKASKDLDEILKYMITADVNCITRFSGKCWTPPPKDRWNGFRSACRTSIIRILRR